MTTFNRSSENMFSAVAECVDAAERIPGDLDVHTITLILNGQHGEFDLVVEATDQDLEDVRFEGIAYRNGGVTDFRQVEPALR